MGSGEPCVVVVGAGAGGLACAIDLARSGFRVTVLERAAAPGGKARVTQVGEVAVDAGPTVITMPWVFDELFHAAGASFRAALPLSRARVLARHVWEDGTLLDLHDDPQEAADAIGAVFGASEARAYRGFCEDNRRIYEIAEVPFLRGQRLTLPGIVRRFGAAGLTALAKLDSHRTMWQALQKRFREPRLRQLFGRYATYVGSSPLEAPATMNLIAHVESEGVFRAAGGVRALMASLEALARSLGVVFRYGVEVRRVLVERGRAAGVITDEGRIDADAVVFNGDVSALGGGLLGDGARRAAASTPREGRSLSAVTWAMHARADGVPLLHHNVFFNPEYPREFEALLDRASVPAEPTVYVCAQDRGDEAVDADRERLLVLINAPPTGDEPDRWGAAERERCTRVMENVLRRAGLSLAPAASVQTTPADFHRLFPATGGALYGPRSRGSRSVLARAGARTKIPRLYLAGGSVHPGAGVPMAALSGRLASARICEDLGSIGRSKRAATTGSTSME